MRTRVILPCIAILTALAACSISDEIVVREDVIEDELEARLAPGSVVVQRVTRFDPALMMATLAPRVLTVDGLGTVVMAGYCQVGEKADPRTCNQTGGDGALVGFCGVFREDGTLQQFACPAGGSSLAIRAGASLFLMGEDKRSQLLEPKGLTAVGAGYSDLWNIDVDVFGGSAQEWSILRTNARYDGATGFGSTGFEVERVRLGAAGITGREVIESVTGSSASSNEPLWVEEIGPGRLAMVFRRDSGDTEETIYREGGTDVVIPLPGGEHPDQIHRMADGTLWLGTAEGPLHRWNPAQGGPVVSTPAPSPGIDAPWLARLGFYNTRAQVLTTDPGYPQFPVPVAYETLHFSGTGLVQGKLALTPCVSRAACREIGESYLLGVVGAGPNFRALYAVWPWETPKPYDPEGKELNHQAMGMYLAPLRAPDEPVGDAGAADTSAEAAWDGEAPEADVTVEAAAEAAIEAATCVDAANTFCDDRDGRAYRQVTIEGQTWMAENLAFDAPGSRCYNDDPANCVKYGRLYQWAIAMAGAASSDKIPSGVQGVCPNGWHLPSKPEWGLLNSNVGPGSAGMQLKSTDLGGTDDWGFRVLGGGYGIDTGGGPMFAYEGTDANFWSTTEVDTSRAWHFFFTQGSITMGEADSDTKLFHYSIRCIKD